MYLSVCMSYLLGTIFLFHALHRIYFPIISVFSNFSCPDSVEGFLFAARHSGRCAVHLLRGDTRPGPHSGASLKKANGSKFDHQKCASPPKKENGLFVSIDQSFSNQPVPLSLSGDIEGRARPPISKSFEIKTVRCRWT